ncbi:MAG: DUF3047 domain-containing protein [Geminicoccaceae bacterium]
MVRLGSCRAVLVVLVLLMDLPALAEVDEALLTDGWSEVLFDGKAPNRFEAFGEDGVAVISERSVSLLQKSLSVDLQKNPVLTWRWQVTIAAPPTDLGVKGGDDRSLALYVAFPFVPEEAGVMERMQRAIVEKTIGKRAPGRVLIYIWGGEGKRDDRMFSPYMDDAGMMTILRPASTETGRWQSEGVDIAEDYRRSFGTEPPDPMSIAIGADTDDTESMVRSMIVDLAFIGGSPDF